MSGISILDMINKEKNERFIKGFGQGDVYLKNVVYKEVIGNEVYQTVDNGVFRFSKSLSVRHNVLYDETSTPEYIDKNLNQFELKVPKIPYKYYTMLIDWYRDIQKKHQTEACLVFFWNTDNVEIPTELFEEHKDGIIIDGQLVVYCPLQWNHGTVSKFSYENYDTGRRVAKLPEMFQWFETNMDLLMETHSHHTMNAYWSNEDDTNERGRKSRLYSVYGYITKNAPKHEVRIGMLGDFFTLRLEDIFELPMQRTTRITEQTVSNSDDSTNGHKKVNTTTNTVEILVDEHGIGLDNVGIGEEVVGNTTLKTEIVSESYDYNVDYTNSNGGSYSTLRTDSNDSIINGLRDSTYPIEWHNMFHLLSQVNNTELDMQRYKQAKEFDNLDNVDSLFDIALEDVAVEEDFDHMKEFSSNEVVTNTEKTESTVVENKDSLDLSGDDISL